MVPFSTLDSALQAAEQKQGEAQIITVLPEGSAVVPRVSGVSG
jgi:hypothetical protein